MLADTGQALSSVRESLKIYPITFFSRYPEPHYSLAAIVFMALDTLDGTYVHSGADARLAFSDVDEHARAAWAAHFGRAAKRLRGAGLMHLIDDAGASSEQPIAAGRRAR